MWISGVPRLGSGHQNLAVGSSAGRKITKIEWDRRCVPEQTEVNDPGFGVPDIWKRMPVGPLTVVSGPLSGAI